MEVSKQISQIKEKPIQQFTRKVTIAIQRCKRIILLASLHRDSLLSRLKSPTEAALSPNENFDKVRHTQHDTPSVETGENPENKEYVTLDWYNLTSTPN